MSYSKSGFFRNVKISEEDVVGGVLSAAVLLCRRFGFLVQTEGYCLGVVVADTQTVDFLVPKGVKILLEAYVL